MLDGIGVDSIGSDHLDRDVELVLTLHAVAGGGHLLATFDGLGPSEDGDRGVDGVFVLGVEGAGNAEVQELSRAPVPPPLIPICPMTAASRKIARA